LTTERAEWLGHAGVVSWGAVFAGAAAAAAFGLILVTLGTGLGLAALSPWHENAAHAAAFGFAAIIWVCVTQILTSGLGGYLAGRLRHRWPTVESDEVYFRDTAHGFLAWAVATLATAALVAATLPAAGRVATQAAANAATALPTLDRGNAEAAANRWPIGYYVDALFRPPMAAVGQAGAQASQASAPSSTQPIGQSAASSAGSGSGSSSGSGAGSAAASGAAASAPAANAAPGAIVSPVQTPSLYAAPGAPSTVAGGPATGERTASGVPPKAEVTRIFLNSAATGDALAAADIAYVARIVSAYTGLSPEAAQARVTATYAQLQEKVAALQTAAKSAADRARHASAAASLWLFVSLLMGAFSASIMAVFGGRLRDA
jgi:hypothetical protein